MFWGYSEAFDFFEDFEKYSSKRDDDEPINILLFGCGDPRNILKTIAKSYKHSQKINFYIIEGCMDIIARHMLLLAIAFEDTKNFSLQNKTHMFMDVYGNSLLRPFSYNYSVSKAEILLKILTDRDFRERVAPIFNFNNLKYKDRDCLENAFTFWQPRPGHIFRIDKIWNILLRKKLGPRYDHREGAFDWDLQMVLKYNGCNQICSQEYRHWRETGIAFTFPEYEHSEPNKSLAIGGIRNGTELRCCDYFGDVGVGPYCSFGLSVPNDKKMSNSFHGANDYRATDLTERNLFEIFSELHNRSPYTHNQNDSRKLGSVVLALGKPITGHGSEKVNLKAYDDPFLDYPNIQIYFQSQSDLLQYFLNSKFINFFDAAFVSSKYFPLIKENFASILKINAIVYFETMQYSINKKEFQSNFLNKIKLFAKKMKLKSLTNFNINVQHSIVKFKYVNSSDCENDDTNEMEKTEAEQEDDNEVESICGSGLQETIGDREKAAENVKYLNIISESMNKMNIDDESKATLNLDTMVPDEAN